MLEHHLTLTFNIALNEHTQQQQQQQSNEFHETGARLLALFRHSGASSLTNNQKQNHIFN